MTRIQETSPSPAATRLKGQEAPRVGPLKPGLRHPRRAGTAKACALFDSRRCIQVQLDPGAPWLVGAPQCWASWSAGPRCRPVVSRRWPGCRGGSAHT